MNTSLLSRSFLGSGAVISLLWLAASPELSAQNGMTKNALPVSWNAAGELERPEGYREWIFVGTPVTPNDMNDGKAAFPEFHNVYIDPASYAVYKATGEFPDGTVLIKELVDVGSKAAVSGQGYFQGEFIGLEATIKSKTRHADEPGYWAYYSFTPQDGGMLKKTATQFLTAQCNACHQAAAADDWVFTQYYPVLRAAKGSR
jgi:hypothetical protein